MRKRVFIFGLIILVSLGAIFYISKVVRNDAFSQIYVFGDSLSDCGNVLIHSEGKFPPEPYYNGRFSDGKVWVERLAPKLGLPELAPSLAGGTNYAFGGSRTGSGIRKGRPNLNTQVQIYLEQHNGRADANGLYVLWAGGNDFLALAPLKIVKNMYTAIEQLAKAGANTFLVPNFPPMGHFPIFSFELPMMFEDKFGAAIDKFIKIGCEHHFGSTLGSFIVTNCLPAGKDVLPTVKAFMPSIAQEMANSVASYLEDDPVDMSNLNGVAFYTANMITEMYNDHLRLSLLALEHKYGIKIYHLDIYSSFNTMLEDLPKYGVKESYVPAMDPKTRKLVEGKNSQDHLFFDGIHPTSTLHEYFAQKAEELIKAK